MAELGGVQYAGEYSDELQRLSEACSGRCREPGHWRELVKSQGFRRVGLRHEVDLQLREACLFEAREEGDETIGMERVGGLAQIAREDAVLGADGANGGFARCGEARTAVIRQRPGAFSARRSESRPACGEVGYPSSFTAINE